MTKKYSGKTTEQFKEDVKIKLGDDYEILDEYKNNKTPILVKHLSCGREYSVTPQSLLKSGKCKDCYVKSKTKTTEQFEKEMFELVDNEYTILSEYVGNKKYIKIRHNLCGNEYNVYPNSFLRGNRCAKCNIPNYDRDTQKYKKEVEDMTNGEYEVVGEYIDYNSHTAIKHNLCGTIWNVTPKCFLGSRQSKCPHCAKLIKVKSKEDFKSEFINLTKGEYTLLSEYTRSNIKITVKHNTCGYIYNTTPNNFLRGGRCPECISIKNSTFSKIITDFLKSNKVKFIKEYSNEECVYRSRLFFDFAILDNDNKIKLLLEVDGQQHFEPQRFGGIDYDRALKNFEETKIRDSIKDKYCEENNIPLLRIPYWEIENNNYIEILIRNNILQSHN